MEETPLAYSESPKKDTITKRKSIAIIAASVLIVLISLYWTFMKPDNPLSSTALQSKISEIELTQANTEDKSLKIKQLGDDYVRIQAITEKTEKEFRHLGGENSENSELHMPSVLIMLEQNASYFGLDFILHYNNHNTKKSNTMEVNDTQEDEFETASYVQQASGLTVTPMPIEVTGDYYAVREYINTLDHIDFIEPTAVEIESLGEKVVAKINISVFSF